METTTVDIEPWNDQTIAHNQDSQSGGDTIDHSMEVIILERNSRLQFFIAKQSYIHTCIHFFAEY